MHNRPDRLRMWRQPGGIDLFRSRIDKQGQHNRENAAFSWNALHIDAAGMALNQLMRDV